MRFYKRNVRTVWSDDLTGKKGWFSDYNDDNPIACLHDYVKKGRSSDEYDVVSKSGDGEYPFCKNNSTVWKYFYPDEESGRKKRMDYFTWDEYFMATALISAERSKDPNTQVGACIVDKNNRIISTGYNGFPINCSDDEYPWDKTGNILNVKYTYVVHAEMNAILNTRNHNLESTRIYVTLFPCNECAKAIIQSGIKEVVYYSDKYAASETTKAAKKMFDSAGVLYYEYIRTQKKYTISL